jgi:hypothetical protein
MGLAQPRIAHHQKRLHLADVGPLGQLEHALFVETGHAGKVSQFFENGESSCLDQSHMTADLALGALLLGQGQRQISRDASPVPSSGDSWQTLVLDEIGPTD